MNNYFMETHHHEWILTNKKGGYAIGTGNLINQRKYHGLLVSGDDNFQRTHLVAGMDEVVEWRGESFHLDSANYSNCVYPEGFLHLVKPWLRPYPVFLYSALPHQNDIMVLKELYMDETTNTILIRYKNLGRHKLHFELHPKYTMHNHHEINSPGSLDRESYTTEIKENVQGSQFYSKRNSNQVSVYGYTSNGSVIENKYIYFNVFYPWEVMNGYPGIGDQVTLFEIKFDLAPGESVNIMFSDEEIAKPVDMIKRIVSRYAELPLPKDYPNEKAVVKGLLEHLDFTDSNLFNRKDYLSILEFALNDFLTKDDIVAGYPWYGPWGRDTMFCLNSLLKDDKYIKLVESILNKYMNHIKDGLIPNMFPESGRTVNYDSVDATLWYVILLYKLGKRKQTVKFWKESAKTAELILNAIINNYKYPFKVREDGLIELTEEFEHATWMDIQLDGKAITPRSGAPVEINALWFNAICSYEEMINSHNNASKTKIKAKQNILTYKAKIQDSFQKFWVNNFLADRLVGDEPISEIRPNALLACSLPWTLLSVDKLEMVFNKAFKVLYTFYGLRSLEPDNIKYRKKYYGAQSLRDAACHNGSVWAWLLGAFCGLYVKINKDRKSKEDIVTDLSNFIAKFRLGFTKGHIATVAELWDGEAPHFPKGAPAMAWSVAAIYNIEKFISHLEESRP